MPNPALPRQVRSALECAPDALPLNDLLTHIDDFVLECSTSEEPEVQVFQFEQVLQNIHDEVADYASLQQTETFLAILYHLGPILPPTSIVSWFDLVLRPALREPKLATQAVNQAKELIISALKKTHEAHAEKVGDFRRRLLEYYLLDAYNEGSGDDVLEWAELGDDERQKRAQWKLNLDSLLLRFGNERPEDLFHEINVHFATPSARLQLLVLLDQLASSPLFSNGAKVLPKLPLMRSLLLSLFLDNSSTLCTFGIATIVKLLPYFAVYAREDLKAMLPKLLAVLARIMCWKERRASQGRRIPKKGKIDEAFERELEYETNPILQISPETNWDRLDMVFDTISTPPKSRPYFTILYYLYPSNVLRFLRGPVRYLVDRDIRSPYVETWEQALDQNEIRRRSENLVREHNCHPLLIWRDAAIELSEKEFWVRYDYSRIVSEAAMLDIRNLVVAVKARYPPRKPKPILSQLHPGESEHGSGDATDGYTTEGYATEGEASDSDAMEGDEADGDAPPPRFIQTIDISSGKAILSLQDMIETTVALKSNLNLEVIQPASQWPYALFSTTSGSLSQLPNDVQPELSELNLEQNAAHVAQAISGLQREILLLRNDLNFELWLSRENSKHIGRLYQDRILMKTAEAERQGLYNKLRKYRAQVLSLESQLQEHKQQASNAKNKYADWNTELLKKLKELREEKKSWFLEAAALRTAQKETQALFVAQGRLLADASKEVFDLQTQRKENQHKIDRLQDYERQIEQHLKVQRLWDEDFAKFNDRENDIKLMQSRYKQMEMRLESLEKTQEEMEENARIYRRQIQTLEARLNQTRRATENPRELFAHEIASFAAEKAALRTANDNLREENLELKDEVEELKAMVEMLRGQHTGGRGLVSARSSPVIPSSFPDM
ncbi:hypothetical protein M413DRAFT_109137 [Hebeloma cylindrosporum]|uniref:Tuberous sclerosis 1 n=1 Tax=Hebeloma cylindrosporum TaxID=76867 RepID=A0A0C2YI83_HEBCY|nr:hypothetical protein M413DRAFT_109137 [Hebeloma cylindrosporum h7]